MKQLKLSEIWIYPIKSLGGFRVKEASVREKGLMGDRRMMLIDEQFTFMTQRHFPQLATLKVKPLEGHLNIQVAGDSAAIGEGTFDDRTLEARIWEDTVTVHPAAPALNEWISRHVGVTCQLVQFPEEAPRPVDPRYRRNNEHVSLADGYPFLIIGQASLDDLNRRLTEPVPMNRFRPNFVFTGGDPYEEDTWGEFTIGTNRFAAVKPCARCVIPTVDQQTGRMGKEPLRTLSRYRQHGNKVLFGQNLLAIDHRSVAEGDRLTVQPFEATTTAR